MLDKSGLAASQSDACIKVQYDETLVQALVRVGETRGWSATALEDVQSGTLSNADFLKSSYLFSRLFDRLLAADEKRVALMMPTSSATMLCFFGAQMSQRVATMLNFTAGMAAVLSACRMTEARTVVTSRQFIERANLGLLLQAIEDAGLRVLFFEDLEAEIKTSDKVAAWLATLSPQHLVERLEAVQPNDPAVILFTSGSEGAPKGVVLSHKNLLSNIAQFTTCVELTAQDKMFACLPLYHSFGLTVGALLPMLSGLQIFFYPSPLHYHEVPKMIRETASTLLLTTDTFLTGYARMGKAEDFASLRIIVPGAEVLKDQTRATWEGHFGKVLLEGYGVTETAPVISVNSMECRRSGSVGRILPDVEIALHPVEGISCGAELWVRGPNVMLGYMKAEAPGVLVAPIGGWHNTGDVVFIDDEGYMTIKGRIRRFAKIGGEMISLVAIEQVASKVCPGTLHAVVSVPHARRGEAIVLMTEAESFDADALRHALREKGLTDLYMPREILHVAKVPVLGSGKLDFITAKARAIELLAKPETERQDTASHARSA